MKSAFEGKEIWFLTGSQDLYGEDTLAQVDGVTCSGCSEMLSPQTMNILMMGRIVFCSSCGALLYLSEDHDSGE